MALDNFLLNLLEDPVDHGTLLYVPSRDVLYNPRLPRGLRGTRFDSGDVARRGAPGE